MSTDFLPLSAVRLLDSPFARAQHVNLESILRLDPARLLQPFRRDAGVPSGAVAYGGWEESGLGGHTAGHVLSALAHALAGGADFRATDMLGSMLHGLREAQLAHGTGYLGGVKDGAALWKELVRGDIKASPFELNGRWVPLYNLHKVLAGLVDVCELAPSPVANVLLDGLGEWWLSTAAQLTQEALEQILSTEFGGFPEAFARLAILRQDPRYLDLALRFVRQELLEAVSRLGDPEGPDTMAGWHANTQVPVVIGYATIQRAARRLDRENPQTDRIGAAAQLFFQDVVHRRSTALGGHGVREHFHRRDDFRPMFLAREGPESCNSYNMIKLAAELYRLHGDDEYLDYIETTQCSHVLSTIHPEHGGLVYFTSHRPGHYRVYSPEQDAFWCCMGSGFEAHSRHGAHAAAVSADELRLIWMLPGTVRWEARGAVVRIESDWPHGSQATITVDVQETAEFTLAIRVPAWAASARLELDGNVIDDDGGWWRLRRQWHGTVNLQHTVERALRIAPSPDGSPWGWLQYGPMVLAEEIEDSALNYRAGGARTAQIASGTLQALAETPVLHSGTLNPEPAGGELVVHAVDGQAIRLKPLHQIHDARYRISWPVVGSSSEVEAVVAALAGADTASTALEARAVDVVTFGEQQPELDHEVTADEVERGRTAEGHQWLRPLSPMTVKLQDWQAVSTSLRLEWLPAPESAAEPAEAFAVGRLEGGDAVVVHADDSGCCELPFGTNGEVATQVLIAPVEGARMPRLRRILLLTDAADS
ncbi:beta-L-arabinofuranosidase domain-containing protein [Arthrobacter sp. M4]|uniref:beta-L-arabinofuranosidase domain-containing protein n=1 Tax=Arthrobacter sp. M4 TaxID=218160 RepID=UPI001CDC538C|nr:beta-L-arabinofuranosidase domain-containing protein [Arthrobacter sp. M4]MCA4131873.1 glycoside hydrolase family 127 protein [Arthrobacter sp. M4]